MVAGTLALSSATNLSLMRDLRKANKKADKKIDALNRAHLIATLYVLKDPNWIKKYEEEIKMKQKRNKIGSKFSNRTKAILGTTVLFAVGTVISIFKDPAGDSIVDTAENIGDSIEGTLEEIPVEVSDF